MLPPALRKFFAPQILCSATSSGSSNTRSHTRILRLGGPGTKPMVVLVADAEGIGPAGFRLPFLRHLFGRPRCGAVELRR
jgi:hypothetical protein